MAFGGFGGGFGQTNNNSSSGFGFGSNNNSTAGGFGTPHTTGAFGAAKPAFGTSTGSGLFGSANTNTTTGSTFGGGGGFGSNNNTAASTGFGSNTGSSSGLFGASKPATSTAFGSAGSGLFGSNNNNNNNAGGFGATNNPGLGASGEAPGTNTVPFQPSQEKEGTSSTTNSFQNILFQDPYKKFSADELRLTDYAQGRRFGNATGGGGFGVSSFGNISTGIGTSNNTHQTSTFGSTSTGSGLFGNNTTNNTTASTGFGANNNTSTTGAFGNTGGGMFGAKPAAPSSGLFGTGNTTTNTPGSGLFGSNNNTNTTNTGFGTNNATNSGFGSTTTAGNGLFGNNTAKPVTGAFGGGFGSNNNTATTGAFGSNNTANTGGFGSNTNIGGGLFGNNNNTATPAGSGLFGNAGATTATNTGFGGAATNTATAGNGLFGNNNAAGVAKPSGLFGSTTNTTPATGTGLFGSGNNTTTTNAFGTANIATNNNVGGGIFGAKPAAPAGNGLFGNAGATAPAAPTNGGIFGNAGTTAAPAAGGGIFGGLGQNQNKGIFGSAQPSTGAFGAANVQPGNQSMFGGQPGVSILGQNNMNQTGTIGGQGLNASINDVSAYGNASLFAGLSGGEVSNPGPLATPMASKGKAKKSNVLPMYKLNPASSSRYATPQKRGFGFSYSTYGTPGTPGSPANTPNGLGRSLLTTSLSRGLSKSVSTNSLRRTYGTEDGAASATGNLTNNSILAPGAFSSSMTSRYYGSSGNLNGGGKKLVINRDLRNDLFASPTKPLIEAGVGTGRKLSKRVSFETNGTEELEPTQPLAAKSRVSALASSERGIKASVSMPSLHEAAKGKELAIVHEEETGSPAPQSSSLDTAPGEYWSSPTIEELAAMNRMQRQSVPDFVVGRVNVGQVAFKVPVDLSNIELDDIIGGIVILETRAATVYPVITKKPPMGRGLNVPAQITLEQSWPRGKKGTVDPKRVAKHVDRLRRIEDTEFEEYDPQTGVWVFSVEHFTTYGLDDDEDDSEFDGEQSVMEEDTPRAFPTLSMQADDMHLHEYPISPSTESSGSDPDDTFDFRHKRRALPGAFELASQNAAVNSANGPNQPSFLGVSSVGSAPDQIMLSVEHSDLGDEYASSDSEDLTGQADGKHLAAEPYDEDSSASEAMEEESELHTEEEVDTETNMEAPGAGVLRARMRALKMTAGPVRVEVTDGDDWMDMLQKTVSPVKRDCIQSRDDNLKSIPFSLSDQPAIVDPEEVEHEPLGVVGEGRGFATTIDLMNSLFERSKPKPQPPQSKGFVQWPYDRAAKIAVAPSDVPVTSRVRWANDGTIVFASHPSPNHSASVMIHDNDLLEFRKRPHAEELAGVRLAKLSTERAAHLLTSHMRLAKINVVNGVPKASLEVPSFKAMFQDRNTFNVSVAYEKLVWDLASILFDPIENESHKSRKDKLSAFWTELVASSCATEASFSKNSEMKAVASLAGHRVQEACKHLLDGKNFHLATMVSLIGTDESLKKDMQEQLSQWKSAMMLSEFTDPIRAIYEMLAGNVCVCEGVAGVAPHDRAETFIISEKFSLDWMQAFGLRLWYATAPSDDLVVAINKFHNDISQKREPLPKPWFVKQSLPTLWDDKNRASRQDLLWGLLNLYADVDCDLQAIVRPENSQMSPLDWRLSWQLGLALTSATDVTFGEHAQNKADSATLSFAAQLINEGSWLEAIFVLLHLTNSDSRAKAICDILAQNAGSIGTEADDNFITLTQVFKVPAAWIWEAQALYMRSVKHDAPGEVRCLLRAGAFSEAHQRFIEQVAPLAVIERDYKLLGSLLAEFENREDAIASWSLGGDIYRDFLTIITTKTKKEVVPPALLTKMLSTLPAMQETAVAQDALVIAAGSEMSTVVARIVTETAQESQMPRILNLPLTEDGHLKHSIDLSISYYKSIMAR